MTSRPEAGGRHDGIGTADRLAWLACACAAAASVLGFVPGLYRDRPVVIGQSHGYDVGNLIAAAVLALGLITLSRPRTGLTEARARIVVTSALGCLAYSYVTYAFFVVLNPATPLYIAVLGLSVWALAVGLTREWESVRIPRIEPALPRRSTAAFLTGVGAVFGVTWLRQLAGAALDGRLPPELQAAGWPTNPAAVLDLAFVVPLLAVAAVGLLRGADGAGLRAASLAGFAALLGGSLVCMSIGAASAGQPVEVPVVLLFALVWLGGTTLLAAALLRSPRGPQGSRAQSRVAPRRRASAGG